MALLKFRADGGLLGQYFCRARPDALAALSLAGACKVRPADADKNICPSARCGISITLALIFFISLLFISPSWGVSGKKPQLKLKKYHLKADKTEWDAKTTILKANRNVKISLYLEDGTTAYIYSDHAEENRGQGKGKAWSKPGPARLVWQDLTVKSPLITFDAKARQVVFSQKGTLEHKNFVRGHLDMDYSEMTERVDAEDLSTVTAMDAKGVWTPLGEPDPAWEKKKERKKQ